jgi:protein farnesyltransferase subunit beta
MDDELPVWFPCTQGTDPEDVDTTTTREQIALENLLQRTAKSDLVINRNSHRDYLLRMISDCPPNMVHLSAEEPWIPYWFMNTMLALNLDGISHFDFYCQGCLKYIQKRKSATGYSSAPEHVGHVVLAWVSVNTIALSMSDSAYESIDRREMYHLLLSLKTPVGSFRSGPDLEADSRSTFCAIAVASLLNLLTPELVLGVAEFLIGCQGYDGGFAPHPGHETHGGYGFASVAALALLGRLGDVDVNAAIKWCAMRQMQFSGGFNGRTNKLVDTCYTWWCGAMARILADHAAIPVFWNEEALASYVLGCCQGLKQKGGFCDKPPKWADMFHTMYGLTGLSVTCREWIKQKTGFEMAEMDARYGITKAAAERMKAYFEKLLPP